jgi:alpha-beta hydrolase superfamily lysophospholipase
MDARSRGVLGSEILDKFAFKSGDVDVACYRWKATATPVGILQIAHGMGEHAPRYARVAEFFANAGFHVYANDHRGHGRTARSKAALGDFGAGGWDALVDDIGRWAGRARNDAPGLPLVLLGHSMGSFAAQQYVLDRSEKIEGLVLSGSTAFDTLGIDGEREVDLAAINAPFEPARTPFDWLSRDEKEVDAYIADPLCGFGANSLKRTADPAALAKIRGDLPVYILAGDADPVNGRLEGLKLLAQRYRSAGLVDVTERYYAGGRHEMFNETNRDEVLSDLLTWLKRVV